MLSFYCQTTELTKNNSFLEQAPGLFKFDFIQMFRLTLYDTLCFGLKVNHWCVFKWFLVLFAAAQTFVPWGKKVFLYQLFEKSHQYTFTCVCVFIDNPYTCCFCSFLSILYENLWFCDYCKSKNGNEITSQLKQQEIMILEQLRGVNGCFHS